MFDQKAYDRAHYLANREQYIERAKARYRADPDAKHEYDRQRRKKLSVELNAYDKERKAKQRGSARAMVMRAKRRALAAGIPFDLTPDDITIPEFCPVLGIRLQAVEGRGGKDCSPSLDKIIPALGYVRGNVQVISHRANKIKHNASLAELEAVCAWLREALGEA